MAGSTRSAATTSRVTFVRVPVIVLLRWPAAGLSGLSGDHRPDRPKARSNRALATSTLANRGTGASTMLEQVFGLAKTL